MEFSLPKLPDDFDEGLREPSEFEMAAEEQNNLVLMHEEVLTMLMRYFVVGNIAETEYRTQAGEEEIMDGIADSHPYAEAGVQLQDRCQEIYSSLRPAEEAVSASEKMEIEDFCRLLKQDDSLFDQADQLVVQAHNDTVEAWGLFVQAVDGLADGWLAEADGRLELI